MNKRPGACAAKLATDARLDKTTSVTVTEGKAALRVQTRARLKDISATVQRRASELIRSRLKEQTAWSQARSILLFAPLSDEPDVWPLIEEALIAKKVAALPFFDPEQSCYLARRLEHGAADAQPGRFGVREPGTHCELMPLNQLDLILVPGLAFDFDGHRLGRGKGFYDRLLSEVRGVTCGIAFDEQIVERIPVEPHDVKLNCILTPTRWREIARPRAVLE